MKVSDYAPRCVTNVAKRQRNSVAECLISQMIFTGVVRYSNLVFDLYLETLRGYWDICVHLILV